MNKILTIIILIAFIFSFKFTNIRKKYINNKRKRNKSWKYYE